MHYRLYVLDEHARIVRGIDLDCRDDGEAIAEAGAYRAEHGVELWQRKIKVARLAAGSDVRAADRPALTARSARRPRGDRTAR